eukprot:TRINITY_DN1644_c0_g1_i13.p4 TRINITY_DN1644_c0_g1~~TRINITY_DN1644_c0_g1_i13.p4  ORF type:complete len:186 (-),score=-21.51 TRINITY_DN1644_c0_g1_i13:622-1179(-)
MKFMKGYFPKKLSYAQLIGKYFDKIFIKLLIWYVIFLIMLQHSLQYRNVMNTYIKKYLFYFIDDLVRNIFRQVMQVIEWQISDFRQLLRFLVIRKLGRQNQFKLFQNQNFIKQEKYKKNPEIPLASVQFAKLIHKNIICFINEIIFPTQNQSYPMDKQQEIYRQIQQTINPLVHNIVCFQLQGQI